MRAHKRRLLSTTVIVPAVFGLMVAGCAMDFGRRQSMQPVCSSDLQSVQPLRGRLNASRFGNAAARPQ